MDRARERYLGRTRDLSPSGPSSNPLFGTQRGDEIRAWLAASGYVAPFAVLDDAGDLAAVAEHHFQTSVWQGLTEEIADRVIAHLRDWRPAA